MISVEPSHSVAIVGDTPEALLISVLYAEAGIRNYLVGPFGENGRTHVNRPGIEEALWLLGILSRSGKICVVPEYRQLPFSRIHTVILASHVSSAENASALEMNARNLAPVLSPGTNVALMGLCSPHYTSSVLKSTMEKYGGLKSGSGLDLYYLPLYWKGERIQEFREEPKVLAALQSRPSGKFQEELLRVFPILSLAGTTELAEASGLFSVISHEVGQALGLELAKISESYGINFDEVIDLCKHTRIGLSRLGASIPGRESMGTGIALSSSQRQDIPKLVRATHSVNEDYQAQIVDLIRRALRHCGYPFRRSRVAILGTDGLLKNSWTKPESFPLVESLRKKGARVSLYPADDGSQPWVQMVGNNAEVESSLLRAVAKASCAVVALPNSDASTLDVDQMATQMNRPGAVCDLTRALEASNVERAGLFYTAIGRGTLDG